MQHPIDDRGKRPSSPARPGEPHYLPIERTRFLRSFHHAFEGIMYATRTQPNMRVHFVIAALVLFATLVLRLDRYYVVAVVTLVALVLEPRTDEYRDRSDRRPADRRASSAGEERERCRRRRGADRRGRRGALRVPDLLSRDHQRRRARLRGGAGGAGQCWR